MENISELHSLFDFFHPIIADISPITDTVFISDWNSSLNFDKLLSHNIHTIICLNELTKGDYYIDEYRKRNIHHHHFYIWDDPSSDLSLILDPIINIILNSPSNCLIHCSAGCSRSVAVAIYYLCRVLNYSLLSSCQHIIKARPCSGPQKSYLQHIYNKLYP